VRGKGLLINATLVIVFAIIIYIIGLSYGNVEVGAYVLLPDGSEAYDSSYDYEVLRSTTEIDSYGVRFGDVLYYSSLSELSVVMISSKASEDNQYVVRVYDLDSREELPIVKTGLKSQLYHSYENIYFYVEDGYTGTMVIEVSTDERTILERVTFKVA